MERLAKSARELRDGNIGIDAFIAGASGWTRGQSARLMKVPGGVPSWLGREDLEQELRIQLWQCSQKYDESRGMPEAWFMSFSARHVVQKIVSKARGIEQHRRTGCVRFDIVIDPQKSSVLNAPIEADAHDRFDRLERYSRVKNASGRVHRAVLDALEKSYSPEQAAMDIWLDRSLGIKSPKKARAIVAAVLCRLKREYEKEAA
jgi:hypothetical protein